MPLSPLRTTVLLSASLWVTGCSLLPAPPEAAVQGSSATTATPTSNALQMLSRQQAETSDADHVKAGLTGNDEITTDQANIGVWDQFRKQSRLDLTLDNPMIQRERDLYQKNAIYLQRSLAKGKPFYFHILNEIDQRGLPSELMLIPLIESAYDPHAEAPGGSIGLWQFIPITARHFNLRNSWWYDARGDLIAATDAALRYFQLLERQFNGDWLLAIAAYNAGEGTVLRAIQANKKLGKPTDFWSLSLPWHTKLYVPRLIAASQIIMQPERYNVALQDIPYEPYFVSLNVESQMDLALAAKMAEVPEQKLRRLNAGFSRWATDPQGPHHLLIPVAQADKFSLALANLPPEKRMQWDHYSVRSGDTLSGISHKFKVPVDEIMRQNHLGNRNHLRIGANLLIPRIGSNQVSATAPKLAQKPSGNSKAKPSRKVVHKVNKGESLWSISKKYNVEIKQLAAWNNLGKSKQLKAGDSLTLYIASPG